MKSLRTTNKDFLASSATLRIDKYNHTSPWRRFLRMSLMFAYVCTWVTFYLLLHYTEMGASIGRVQQRHDDRSAISAVQVLSSIIFVICVEIIKILFSVRLYLMNGSPSAMAEFCELPVLKRLLIRYLPTAILYTIYNILMLLNLRSNAPTAYLIITSSRLVITAVAWKAFFKDGNVTPLRKLAIVIITLGIFTRGISGQEGASYARPWSYSGGQQPTQMISHSHHQITSVMLILFQVMCSVLAGIYNEKTLKNDTCSHHLHNICLYLDSIAVNVIVGLVIFAVNGGNDDGPIISHLQIENLLSPSAILIILTLSIAGIMSSLVLRYENSITKCIASASETICTSLLEFFWFGRSFKTTEWISIFLVSMGTVLYTKDSISWKVSTRKIVNLCLLLYIMTLFLFFSLYPTHIDKGLGNMVR
jgi:drug/metabolite transporter (DMT)-like permease